MSERGLKVRSLSIALLVCLGGYSNAPAATRHSLTVIYLSPLPDSKYNLPVTNIVVRTDGPVTNDEAQGLILGITGSVSGAHNFPVRVSDDSRTIVCQPATPFSLSETVTVRLDTAIARPTGRAASGTFSFLTAPLLIDSRPLAARLRATDFPPSVSPRKHAQQSRPTSVKDEIVLPVIDVTVSEAPSPGNLFLASLNWSYASIPTLLILRNDGSQVFARNLSYNGYDFKPQPNGNLTYYDDGPGQFYEMDPTCTVIDSFQAGNGYGTDPHEFLMLPNGHVLFFAIDNRIIDMSQIVPGGYADAEVVGYAIQELDQNKNVVFQWRTFDHFNITDAKDIDLTSTWIDYVHCNSIDVDTDGNLLLSSRHFNEVTKINRETGDIIWRLGGNNNQFTFINDPLGFNYQHAVRRIDNGDITMFDNGDFHVPAFSRAVEYAIDTARKTATLVWQYRNTPDVLGYAMGYVQRLPNGNTLIGWGAGNPTVTEVSPSGNKLFEMTFDEGVYSYRAYRYEWQPVLASAILPAAEVPVTFSLSQNYPNPFNPSTTIQFSLARDSHVDLVVYNTLGERVATLENGELPAGRYSRRFDGTRLASGVYIYRLRAGDFTSTQKMLLLR